MTNERRCSHGWTESYLNAAHQEAKLHLRACIDDHTHPFQPAMVAGARQQLVSVSLHILEIAQGKPLQSEQMMDRQQ